MQKLNINEFLQMAQNSLLIDVRAPAEFKQGHIPGAMSLPLFNDEQRAQVGSLYKKSGKQKAIVAGLEIVGPKLLYFYQQVKLHANDRPIAVHCWRGGLRSANMAHFLAGLGWSVAVLIDGYKSYRQYVLETLAHCQLPLIVIGGYTGSGKTEILHDLQERDQAILDLEGLAAHKGSAFGNLTYKAQPTQEQFENDLCATISALPLHKTVWIEDESARIGARQLPKNLYQQIRSAPVCKIELPTSLRVQRLVQDYADQDDQQMMLAIQKITRRLGGLRTKISIAAIQNQDYASAAVQILDYYDRAYSYGQNQRDPKTIHTMPFAAFDLNQICAALIAYAQTL